MKNRLTYEEFEKIMKINEKTFTSWIDYDFEKRESQIYISFSNSNTIIETLNFKVMTLENIGEHVINSESDIYIYYSTEDFLSELDIKYLKQIKDNPFFQYRSMMSNFEANRKNFLKELFVRLGVEQPNALCDTNLDEFNNSLKAYGYEKLYNELYLHLIIFCGEYLDEMNGNLGKWTVKCSDEPLSFEPVYIDQNGNSSYISLNVFLARDLIALRTRNKNSKKKKPDFKIETITGFAGVWKKARMKIIIEKDGNVTE